MITATLTFRQDYWGGRRWVAYLGAVQVGAIIVDGPKNASWIEWLPTHHGGGISSWKTERGEAAARLALTNHLRGWLERCGLASVAFGLKLVDERAKPPEAPPPSAATEDPAVGDLFAVPEIAAAGTSSQLVPASPNGSGDGEPAG